MVITFSNREDLIQKVEKDMCLTRKLFCPSAEQVADVMMYLKNNGPATYNEIINNTKVPRAKVNEVLSVCSNTGYIQQEKRGSAEVYKLSETAILQ